MTVKLHYFDFRFLLLQMGNLLEQVNKKSSFKSLHIEQISGRYI